MSYRRVIHWFRRDLRVADNTALNAAVAASAEVIPVYIRSTWKGAHDWTGPGRQHFLSGCLLALANNVSSLGGQLIFRAGDAVEELGRLAHETKAEAIFLNRDPDPFGIAVEQKLRGLGLPVHDCKDCVMHERAEILSGTGTPYRVYTPYLKTWFARPKDSSQGKPAAIRTPVGIASLPCPTLADWGLAGVALPSPMPEPGERAARERLKVALAGPIRHYAQRRNIPAGQTTSLLSQDYRYGLLSIREVFAKVARLEEAAATPEERQSYRVYLQELAWREFYMQILWHFPEVLEQEFDPQYRGLPWGADEAAFARWASGTTGFPIVDAGMRQLNQTGLLHNRVRMIVAMFLTKDLRQDWRMGERYFNQQLLDGEIASNNGGWQWSAGTGADAAPYFRIQNPWEQTKRYDPDGAYIKAWVPELRAAPAAVLGTPPASGLSVWPGYPAPMVDHKTEREKTLEFFQAHRRESR